MGVARSAVIVSLGCTLASVANADTDAPQPASPADSTDQAPAAAPAPAPTTPAVAPEAATTLTPPPAAPETPVDPAYRPVEHERRAGVVVGAAVGAGFGAASGYTNSPQRLGDPDYYSSTPLLVGIAHSYFVMGALTDYLSVGPLLSIATFDSSEWRTTGFGVGFRIEVFPLLKLAPTFADTAAYAQLGLGSTRIAAKGPYPDSDGTQSFLGLGLHHEFRLTRLLGGHAAAGPFADYNAIRAQSAERHWATVGLRLAWYAGTVAADAP